MVLDTPTDDKGDDEGGVGAYVKAIKGRDAIQRGRGGRLKFSNKRSKDEDDEMDVDEDDLKVVKKQIGGNSRDNSRGRGGRGGPRGGRGGIASGRRGLGEEKRHGNGGHRGRGGVIKSPRGKGRR
jgi:ribosomal RNA-processing protein 12